MSQPDYDETTDAALMRVSSLMQTPMCFLRLALACLDQAGVDVATQRRIERLALQAMPEPADEEVA